MPTIVAVVMLSLTLTATAQGSPAPDTSLGIASVPNLRDVGGNTTQEGSVVRLGVVYRSGELNPITRDDMNKLAALGLRNDFRPWYCGRAAETSRRLATRGKGRLAQRPCGC